MINELVVSEKRKFYVYRLIDPRTLQTFYVGKGCGNRVFQHVNDVMSLISKNEDAESLKSQYILDILGAGKQVIAIIHRRGLTNNEALEVEAALIDSYPGLTNIQKGHHPERGLITVDDLKDYVRAVDYNEPVEDYIIIKTSPIQKGMPVSLYQATRYCWRASLARAKKYRYVLSVVNGIVREVYKVERWYQATPERIAFEGSPTADPISSLKNKRIPAKYRSKGLAYPFIYKK